MAQVPVYESTELSQPVQDALATSNQQLPVPGATLLLPAIIISRHQSTGPSNDNAYYGDKLTHVEGFDASGALVETRSLLERSGLVGRLFQKTVEHWKLGRVQRATARAAAGHLAIDRTVSL